MPVEDGQALDLVPGLLKRSSFAKGVCHNQAILFCASSHGVVCPFVGGGLNAFTGKDRRCQSVPFIQLR